MSEYSIKLISKLPLATQLKMIKYYMDLIGKPTEEYNIGGAKHSIENNFSKFNFSSKNNESCTALLSDYFVYMLFDGKFNESDLNIINLAHNVKMSEIFEDPYIEGLLKHVEEQKNNPIFDNPTNSSQLNNIPTDNPNM